MTRGALEAGASLTCGFALPGGVETFALGRGGLIPQADAFPLCVGLEKWVHPSSGTLLDTGKRGL